LLPGYLSFDSHHICVIPLDVSLFCHPNLTIKINWNTRSVIDLHLRNDCSNYYHNRSQHEKTRK
jgi:hypothetical protein